MRKVYNILGLIFTVISIAFSVFPTGTLGLLPSGLAVVFSALAFFASDATQRKFPKILLIVSGLLLLVIGTKAMLPDEVAQDSEFEQKQIESKTEDLKDIEELDAELQ